MSMHIRNVFLPAEDFAEEHQGYTGRGQSRYRYKKLLRYALLGDSVLGLSAGESVFSLDISRSKTGIMISQVRSNNAMAAFSEKMNLFDRFVRKGDGSRKKRADFLEGWFGFLYETQGRDEALRISRIYTDFLVYLDNNQRRRFL